MVDLFNLWTRFDFLNGYDIIAFIKNSTLEDES